MKHFFLILPFLLPLCTFLQEKEDSRYASGLLGITGGWITGVERKATDRSETADVAGAIGGVISGDALGSSVLEEFFDTSPATSANPWAGDLDCFRVTEAGELQLAADPLNKHARLWLPLPFSRTMQWEFEIRMNLNPTNFNHAKVFVYSTLSSVTGKVEQYYVQIGSNNRDVTLRSLGETEKTPTILIAGEKNLADQEKVSLKVKLTLEEEEEWNLYTCMAGESKYKLQGKYRKKLSDLRESGYFRLECVYSKTHAEDFFFDNIRIMHEITPTPVSPDEGENGPEDASGRELPALVNFSEENETCLFLYFDQAVDVESASFLLDGCGEAEEVSISDDETVVRLVWETARRKGHTYTLLYSGVMDKEKKREGKGVYSFTSQKGTSSDNGSGNGSEDDPDGDSEGSETPSSFPPGSLLINEIMADPKGLVSLPQTEYVELYNASGVAVSLQGWMFLYGGKPTALAAYVLPPAKYLVLYREGREIWVSDTGQAMPLAAFPSALANTGKLLQLKDPSGQLIDEVIYEKAKPAVSWERSATGWHLSADPAGGTPGASNSTVAPEPGDDPSKDDPDADPPLTPTDPDTPSDSISSDTPPPPVPPGSLLPEPGEIVFNELLPNPFPEGSEYIELYNRSVRELSLAGLSLTIRKADGSLSTRYPLASVSAIQEPGGYALLTKDKEGVTPFYLISSPSALHTLKLPVLANTSSTLVLFRTSDGVVIDEISYSAKWHAASVKNQKGVALERIDPDSPTQDPSNWISATETAGYGTPGYCNSQYKRDEPGHATGIEPPVFSDITGDYTIAYYLDHAGYHCRAWVYDTAGRRRAEIAAHALMGMEGKITWKGEGIDGRPLRAGLYILYLELYHENGQVRTYRKVFVVH